MVRGAVSCASFGGFRCYDSAMRWEERRSPELGGMAEKKAVAILPLGAIEAHGPHLPIGADIWIAEAMAREWARILNEGGFAAFVLGRFVQYSGVLRLRARVAQ